MKTKPMGKLSSCNKRYEHKSQNIRKLLLFKIEGKNYMQATGWWCSVCIFMCNTNISQVLKHFFFLSSSYFFFLVLYIVNAPCNGGNAAKCFPGKNTRVIKFWKKSGAQTRCQYI